MYFAKASKTLRFLVPLEDNIRRGTCFLYCLLKNIEIKKRNKGEIHYEQAIFWFFRHNR